MVGLLLHRAWCKTEKRGDTPMLVLTPCLRGLQSPLPLHIGVQRLLRRGRRFRTLKRRHGACRALSFSESDSRRRGRCDNLVLAERHFDAALSAGLTSRLRYLQMTGVVALTGRWAERSWKVGDRMGRYRAAGWRLSQKRLSVALTCPAFVQAFCP
ncbi:uncharacterized protein CC84DRAFT_277073 [Paraphaeosphaeria sporulosa]|uniref:Uncharacterized protein n=1 Tax=Paraphaeosphaeria sporulosa TaxID=1460663 RepID=A0A177C2L7_9PLEO|nr:uncharacterized protein CC84DRAFT_277073 [Paraphaeosphaeria sporulosa]OAG01139.1 hypothetical protein CC84DRAFT_277073 [Paraphaeosphaeria sporulosa]